ncbi:phage major capsid protein [bacterium]|nr:MAG: phage major capsid protein [bacterium]
MAAATKAIKAQLQNDLDAALEAIEKETDPVKAKELLETAKGIKAQIEQIDDNDAELAGLKAYQTSPATARDTTKSAVVGGAGGGATKANVGTSEIDVMTGEVVHEEGAGVLTSQQVKAVMNPGYLDGFKSFLRAGGDESKMKGTKANNNAFLAGNDNEGGRFVPVEVIAGIIKRDPTPTRIVDKVRTQTIGTDSAQVLRANYDSDDLYSSNVRIYKTGEAEAFKKADKPQFGLKKIDVHGWTAEISISRRFLDDTNFDILGYFAEEFRIAIRNLTAKKVLLGTGVGEHFGILTRVGQSGADGIGFTKSGDANLLTWDSLRKLKNTIPEQYDQNASWLFNKKSTMDAIEGFKDANLRDLWPESQRAGGIAGVPGMLRGYGYDLEAFMPDIAANALPILLGDYSGYMRLLRMGMNIQVLREIEARNGQVVFLVEFREGGDVVRPWMMKALKIAA